MSIRIITIVTLFLAFMVAAPVTAYLYAQSTASAEVRITARLLENGKVEFGLQQRTDGRWGERILPRINKFPYATATVDRWLVSSSVQVSVEQEPSTTNPGATAEPSDDPPPARITHSHCQRVRNDGGCDRRFRPPRCPTHTHTTLAGHRNDHC